MGGGKLSIDHYVESAGEASKRSRWVLLVLIVASIFGYAGYLAARPESWPWHRLELLNLTLRCADVNNKRHADCSDTEASQAGELLLRWEYIKSPVQTVKELEQSPVDVAALKHHIEHQRDSIMDKIANQTVPVLGFSFDVNELGKIASATFVAMLLVMLLSLRRERQNVQLLRSRAILDAVEDKDSRAPGKLRLSEARDLIYMRQVFSIVSNVNTEQKPGLVLRLASKVHFVLVWLPIVVEGHIISMDIGTMGIGNALSSDSTRSLLYWEGIGGLVCILLAALCNVQQHKLDKEFEPAKWIVRAPRSTEETSEAA